MSKQPLISICLLTYNHEKYISESIESILIQEYENWELLIVDNASSDDTRNIIESYAKKDSRIIFLPQERNLYVSKGLNIAIEKAKGEYVALLSGDDAFYPEKLNRQLQYMQEKELELSFTWITTIDDDSKPSAKDIQKWFNRPKVKGVYEIISHYLKFQNIICAPTTMIKKSLLNKIALHDNRLLQTQDMEFSIRMIRASQKVAILQEKLTYYRVLNNGGNLSSNNTSTKRNKIDFEMLHVYKELCKLDNSILSKVFNTDATDENRYHLLYSHFEKNDLYLGKIALMQYLFEKLGADADVSTSSFLFFFEKYGEITFVDKILLDKKDGAVKCLEEQLKNHKKTLIAKEEEIIWLKEQLENHKKALVSKEEGIVWLEKKLEVQKKELFEKETTINFYENFFTEIDTQVLLLEEDLTNHKKKLESKIIDAKPSELIREITKKIKRKFMKLLKKIPLKGKPRQFIKKLLGRG